MAPLWWYVLVGSGGRRRFGLHGRRRLVGRGLHAPRDREHAAVGHRPAEVEPGERVVHIKGNLAEWDVHQKERREEEVRQERPLSLVGAVRGGQPREREPDGQEDERE